MFSAIRSSPVFSKIFFPIFSSTLISYPKYITLYESDSKTQFYIVISSEKSSAKMNLLDLLSLLLNETPINYSFSLSSSWILINDL